MWACACTVSTQATAKRTTWSECACGMFSVYFKQEEQLTKNGGQVSQLQVGQCVECARRIDNAELLIVPATSWY